MKTEEHKGKPVCPQSLCPDFNHLHIALCKLSHNFSGKQNEDQSHNHTKAGRPEHGYVNGFSQSLEIFCTEAKPCNGLKALDKAENSQASRGDKPRDSAHSRKGRVTVRFYGIVCQSDGKACQQLKHKHRDARKENNTDIPATGMAVLRQQLILVQAIDDWIEEVKLS